MTEETTLSKSKSYSKLCYSSAFIFFLVAEHFKMQLMQGFSMVPLYYRDKIVLVSFGGNKKEPSDKVKYLTF
jgi:hypothetical protein